ncbi:hypothetical protein FNL56_16345 [Tardiphaga sp. vice304]|uniref:hypothetical protein n=1 Tax=Tardiphaga sp. vice304 TaxID=2592817 RepID=UPI00116497CE|nr:hypothetical protein [Tardiphaga sp. vice304]QDM27516.1 hypothetical protein FNL56_16345 [Tardiphaga sp. vice304]
MSITIEAEGMTVLLPEMPLVTIEPDKARAAIKRDRAIRRSHLFPLFDAVANFACSFLIAPQGCETFELPRSPWILYLGDDLHFVWGPRAFPADSLDKAINEASYAVIVSSGPEPYPYRMVATMAAKHRKNVLLIETRPNQSNAWKERIKAIRGSNELPVTHCMTPPEAA